MNIITTPAMVLTVLTGGFMVYVNPYILDTWLYIKFGLVFLLIGYHHYCKRLMNQFIQGLKPMTSTQLRVWNEGATLLLFAIVFLVVLKNTLDMMWGVLGLVSIGVLMMIAIKLYKKSRDNN